MERTEVVLEVALNGATSKKRNATVPVTPDEIAADALRCLAAGAAIVHTHSDRPRLAPREGAERYAEAYRAVLAERPDAILYPTLAAGREPEARYGHERHLAREGLIRQGILDPGSVNLSGAAEDGLPLPGFVYVNTPDDIRLAVAICREHALGPSVAIFEPGYLRVILAAQRAGSLPAGTLVKLYFSRSGYAGGGEPTYGAPPVPEALELYLAMLGGSGLPFAVAVLGGGLLETPIARLALERGGHLRVGLEDHPGAASNLAEVEKARALCHEVGRDLASPTEACEILRLPRSD